MFQLRNVTFKLEIMELLLISVFLHFILIAMSSVSEQSDRRVRLTFSVFISNALFRNGQLENSSGESAVNVSLNGKVVAARLSVDGDAVTNLTGGAITTVFSPITVSEGDYRCNVDYGDDMNKNSNCSGNNNNNNSDSDEKNKISYNSNNCYNC